MIPTTASKLLLLQRRPTRRRSSAVLAFTLVYIFLILPLAYPFVSGTTPSSSSVLLNNNNNNNVVPTSSSRSPDHPPATTQGNNHAASSPTILVSPASTTTTRTRTKTTRGLPRTTRLFFSQQPLADSTNGNVNPDDNKRQRQRRRRWWRFFSSSSSTATADPVNQNSNSPQSTSTATSTATSTSTSTRKKREDEYPLFFSRLSFSYILPLIQSATARHLQVEDAFDTRPENQMEPSVTKLAHIHQQLRRQERNSKQQQRQQQKPSSSQQQQVSTQAWILTKALLLQQRRMLLLTGVLRLVNTGIQAFPALLVARLLRLAEAGQAVPLRQAVQAALALVLVLTTKMITENQYFHYVVKCATNVRGSLSGLIFDKALSLPGGGSGVIHPTEDNNVPVKNKKTLMNGKQQQQQLQSSNATTTINNMNNNEAASKPAPVAIGSGGVLNLMQSDTSIIELAALQVHTTWDGILQLALYTYLLYRVLGPSVMYGCAVLVATIPLNSLTLRLLNRLSKYENEAKDARTKRTAESITNMKLLKLFGWEQTFADDIRHYRREELQRHVSRGVVRALNSAISNAVPALVLVVTLRAYAKTGAPIVASTIFTAISLFNQLRFPLFFYPMLIDALANGRNAIRRIANFLATEETVPYVQYQPPLQLRNNGSTTTTTGGAIQMSHGNFLWSVDNGSSEQRSNNDNDDEDDMDTTAKNGAAATTVTTNREASSSLSNRSSSSTPALARVNLTVAPGEIVAVVGSVGSGKSALIKGLLGELNPVPGTIMEQILARPGNNGNSQDEYNHNNKETPEMMTTSTSSSLSSVDQLPTVTVHGEVAYCSQEAWLPKGSIRDAIIFGRPYDEARYLSAVRDAGLDKDIVDDEISSGDVEVDPKKGQLSHDTDVGEHGSSLSGGQRARVALARALYSNDATVFLLDDCLAALDASVGSTVFERLSTRLRARNAAVVLVTNDPSLPRRCDRTVLMGTAPGSASSCSTIIDVGSYDELLARGHDLRSISTTTNEEEEEEKDGDTTILDNGDRDRDNRLETAAPSVQQQQQRLDRNHQSRRQNRVRLEAPPKLMKLNKYNLAATVARGGPANGTTWSSCHSHPESTFTTLDNCPVEIYENRNNNNDLDESPEEPVSLFMVEKPDDIVCHHNITEEVLPPIQPELVALANGDQVTSPPPPSSSSSTPNLPRPTPKEKVKSMDESMSSGAVPISTYVSYFKAVRQPLLIAAMLLSFLTVNGAQLFQQYTVARWSDVAKSGTISAALGAQYMRSLVLAAGVVSVFLWLRSFFSMKVGVRASEFLHSRMLSSVFHAPLSFFDATDSGQLLSRFGKETETVDRGVPDSFQSTLFCFLQIFMSMGALAGAVTPAMLFPLGAVGILYARTMILFRPAARDMKRAEAKTRSPIYTHFGEALRGAETIRSIPGAKRVWSSMHRSLTDVNLGVFYTVKAMDRWLSTRLETLGNVVVLTVAMASVYLTRLDRLGAGAAGWGLTQALSITGLLTWAVRCLTDLESSMMSVVRVKELTNVDAEGNNNNNKEEKNLMPREPANAGEALQPLLSNSHQQPFQASLAPSRPDALVHSGWPWRGNIRFKNVSMRYNAAAPLVLRNISLTVPAGTTLGVVGRTGSGKSSLLLTLFRLMEVEPDGSIEIDGVDIRAVPLSTLRQSLAIIPQDPTLFQGTVASNLDATGHAKERDMWMALEAASPALARQFREEKGLQTPITEGGKNLSQGQRQLICLARALLRQSKILVLDEATSSVDSKTDQEVQATIRREFVDKGVTVITVAHRLDTVLGYDKIAVLGAGSVLEYGSPKQLLQDPKGELRQLVEADNESKRKGAKQASSSSESNNSSRVTTRRKNIANETIQSVAG